jgi:hypothetical protein
MAAPNLRTSDRGKATDTEAIIPPKTIAKLDGETNPPIPALAAVAARNIPPKIDPNPRRIPINVAISIFLLLHDARGF